MDSTNLDLENMGTPLPLPNFEAKDIYEAAVRFWKKYSMEKAEKEFYGTQECLESPDLVKFLCWKYRRYPILKRGRNTRYPVATFKASETQELKLDSILEKPLKTDYHKEDFIFQDAKFRALATKIGLPLINKTTYDMVKLDVKSNLKMTCRLGWYFDMLDTSFALYWELLSEFTKLKVKGSDAFSEFDQNLKLRNGLHSCVKDPIRDGTGRSNSIGVSTVIAFNDQGVTKLWVKRRSQRGVAIYPNRVSILPSGMFQPLAGFAREEYSTRHAVFREYLEELFNFPEGRDQETYNYFYEDPRLKRLTSMIGLDQAQLFLTGVSVDLLTLRPEISTLLWIKSPEWFLHHSKNAQATEKFSMNQEFERESDQTSVVHRRPRAISIPFSFKDDDLLKNDFLSPESMSPVGAGTLWLGIDKLRSLLG